MVRRVKDELMLMRRMLGILRSAIDLNGENQNGTKRLPVAFLAS